MIAMTIITFVKLYRFLLFLLIASSLVSSLFLYLFLLLFSKQNNKDIFILIIYIIDVIVLVVVMVSSLYYVLALVLQSTNQLIDYPNIISILSNMPFLELKKITNIWRSYEPINHFNCSYESPKLQFTLSSCPKLLT